MNDLDYAVFERRSIIAIESSSMNCVDIVLQTRFGYFPAQHEIS